MKRHVSIALSIALLCMVAIAGCNGSQSPVAESPASEQTNSEAAPSSDAPESEPAGEGEPVTLTILTRWSGSDPRTPMLQAACAEFMEQHPGVTIQDDSVSEESAYNNKLKTAIATGDLPNMFTLTGVMTGVEYAKNGILMDVSELFDNQEWYGGFPDGAFEMWNYELYGAPGYYAVPDNVGVEVFYYNKDLFTQAGITEPPATVEQFYDAVDKLKAIEVVPLAVGGKDTWRAGHVFNWIFFKNLGVEKAKEIGVRSANWTDADVVETLGLYMDLKERGTFPVNYEGMSHDEEKAMFFTEQAAMVLNGSWFIGDCISSDISEKIGVFALPTFADKPEFSSNAVIYPQALCLSGKAIGAERDMQVEFITFLTSQAWQQRCAEEIQQIPSRKDVDLSGMDPNSLFVQASAIAGEIGMAGGDTFDYDPLPSMQDRTRNSLIGMSLGNTPEAAAKEIQDEIDKNS